MPVTIRLLALVSALLIGADLSPAQSAEREQVRMVINLIASVKMPFPENLRNSLARTERVQLDTNGATVACLRLDDKIRWCYECPSSGNLRLIRRFEKRGSGSSGLEFRRPAVGAASGGLR